MADPRDLRTVNAAAKCLKASVSGPPPATSNSCLSSNMEAYVFPEPLVPGNTDIYIYNILCSNILSLKKREKKEKKTRIERRWIVYRKE